MKQDFLAGLLYHLYSEDKKEHPMPPEAKNNLFQKIHTLLKCLLTSGHKEGE